MVEMGEVGADLNGFLFNVQLCLFWKYFFEFEIYSFSFDLFFILLRLVLFLVCS